MNILIFARHWPVASGRYVRDALRRLGHTVYTDGPAMGNRIWGLHLPDGFAWQPEPPPEGTPLDLAIVMDSDPAILDGAARYAGHAPLIVHGVDNHCRDYRRPYFDRYYLAHLHPSVMPWLPDMVHIPCGYDPALFTPSPIPFAERQYDVAVLGVMYPDRLRAVAELQAAGLKVIWGCGLVGESYRDAHHDSRIALCLPARNDVAQRIFECAAMGNLVVTPYLPDFRRLNPRGLFVLREDRALADQVMDAMLCGEHTAAAREWASGYTWDRLATQVLEGKQ